MHLRTKTCLVIGVLCAGIGLYYLSAKKRPLETDTAASSELLSQPAQVPGPNASSPTAANAASANPGLANQPQTHSPAQPSAAAPPPNPKSGYRVTNSRQPLATFFRSDSAVLLRNAFLDTAVSENPVIPEALKSTNDPGSYVIQARGVIDDAFRNSLTHSGAKVVAYVPNNAYLVRASANVAAQLKALPATQAVLPFEPYYKLDQTLLGALLDNKPLPEDGVFYVVGFPGENAQLQQALSDAHSLILATDRSPFGPVFLVKPIDSQIARLAQLPEVQSIEVRRGRAFANDLSRVRTAVTPDPLTTTNYLDLTGDNVLVNMNDSGVDSSHPGLVGRVSAADPAYLQDSHGHGTHVAGTIAGDGTMSDTVTNAPGSLPGANFRGMAPKAKLYVLPVDVLLGPLQSDVYLQETAAKAKALLSNNSWNYPGRIEYDSAAASYDAAVRDALPDQTGPTPMVFVFAAGNEGNGDPDGFGGEPGSITSPGTAKNVITVGAIDNFRNITNEVIESDNLGTTTNQAFLGQTDSDNQVCEFSSRGNVGIGMEGLNGRFKPDVVAPGAFLVSARSSKWKLPTAFTNAIVNHIANQILGPGEEAFYSLFLPTSAIQAQISILPSQLFRNVPGLPIYLKYGDFPTDSDFITTNNLVVMPGDFNLQPGGELFYRIVNTGSKDVAFDIETLILNTNQRGDFFDVLKQLDDGLGPYYRYESGTSMAAPVVTGMLALMREFLDQKLHLTNASPALMKALLINGAHSVNPDYSLAVNDSMNYQGWGLISITNSLPEALKRKDTNSWPLLFYDQSPTNALATGQQRNWKVTLSTEAQFYPLRFTLVWTDPPGNPVTAIKLVNDLDLVVTNLDTGDVYYGNDIPVGFDYNQYGNTNAPSDFVNNVENVFLRQPLGTNFAASVYARRVNVNAVTTQTNGMMQDYALVISTGNPVLTNAITLKSETQPDFPPLAVKVTNGIPLLNQRVGANFPLSKNPAGTTNQWRFFVFENIQDTNSTVALTNGPNVAFITFIPPNLARPRTTEADIDLYVSTNSALTNLDAAVLANADRSTNRGGTELVFYTNAAIGEVFYIGVKSEDQQAAEFGFVSLSSTTPFDEDINGNRLVHVMPPLLDIPDGSPDKPGGVYAFGIATQPIPVRRVLVTNIIGHEDIGDLVGNLSHNREFVVLNNHTLTEPSPSGTNIFVYDDSNQGDIMGSVLSDGPGSLNNFVGMEGSGVWLMTMTDSALTHSGKLDRSDIFIERGSDGLNASVLPGRFAYFYTDMPEDAVRLTIEITSITPAVPIPLELYVRRENLPSRSEYDKSALIAPPGGLMNLSTNDVPPLTMGRYYIGVFNPNGVVVNFYISIAVKRSLEAAFLGTYTPTDTPRVVQDDAWTRSTIHVPDDRLLTDVKVGIRIDHPRISDLAIDLISPQGTRVMLTEARGGIIATNYGSGEIDNTNLVYAGFTENTNLTTAFIKFAKPPFTTNAVITSIFSSDFEGLIAGVFGQGSTLDGWTVLTNSVEIVTTNNAITGTNLLALQQGRIARSFATVPGRRYWLSFHFRSGQADIISAQVLLDGRLQPWLISTNTDWQMYYLSFTASRAETLLEIAPALRNDVLLDGFSLIEAGGIMYYLPEESLDLYKGEDCLGDWTLEIWDMRAGPGGKSPQLLTWQLQMAFVATNYNAITLTNGIPYTSTVSGNEKKYFIVNAPRAALFGTNIVVSPGDVILMYNADGLPVGNPTVDYVLDAFGPGGEILVLDTVNAPLLHPGQRYYLAVANANPLETNNFTILADFDRYDSNAPKVRKLTNDIPVTATLAPGAVLDYYEFDVATNGVWATFEVTNLTGNVTLLLKKSTPLPTIDSYHYLSDQPGTNSEAIMVTTNSLPTPLSAGAWYLAVVNRETNSVAYTIVAHEYTNAIPIPVPLTNGVSYTQVITNGLDYYEFTITPDATWASFEILNPEGNVNLLVRHEPLFPTLSAYDYHSINPGTNDELILVFTNSVPVPLTAGIWYLAVYNLETNPVAYTVRATEYTGPAPTLITLTNGISFTNTVYQTNLLDLYRFRVSGGATQAVFEVFGMNGDVDLFAKKGLPLVDATNAFYVSQNPGTNSESIVIHTNSTPIALSPGEWFLGVLSRETNPVNYVIKATEFGVQPPVTASNIIISARIDRTNQVLILTWNSIIGSNYVVQGKVRVNDPTWNDVSPVITATNIVTTYSVSLTNTNHFFQVIQSAGPGGTVIIPPINLITQPRIPPGSGMELIWDSAPGVVYSVQATTNFIDWFTLTNITATGNQTTYVDPTPANTLPLRFYRVEVAGGGIVNPPPIAAVQLQATRPQGGVNGIKFVWNGQAAITYVVQYSDDLKVWLDLSTLTGSNTNLTYLDPTPVSSLPQRFFRVRATR
jgi:subtilisin-like proprotein convertase family protein